MRIISGSHRGRHIEPPKNLKARPTTDFAKTALFNILQNCVNFNDIEVLDLFSGTGSISYEFASRGAKSVISIENNFSNYSFIREMAKKLNFNINVINSNAFSFVQKAKLEFDVIFCDPPYDNENISTLPNLIFENNLLKKDGILIVEHSKKINFSEHSCFKEVRNYGSVHFSFFSK